MNPFYPLVIDDGGRSMTPGRFSSVNDCTVRSLAIAARVPYYLVHETLKSAGRRTNQGFEIVSYLGHRRTFLGHPFKSTRFRRNVTIGEAVKMCRRGHYILDTYDHVLAVVDGVAHDLIRLDVNDRVFGIWRFED